MMVSGVEGMSNHAYFPGRTRYSMKKGKTNGTEIFKSKVAASRNKAKIVKKSRKINRK